MFKFNNYSSVEDVLYGKPHYEQLFNETDSLKKNFQSHMFVIFELVPH